MRYSAISLIMMQTGKIQVMYCFVSIMAYPIAESDSFAKASGRQLLSMKR